MSEILLYYAVSVAVVLLCFFIIKTVVEHFLKFKIRWSSFFFGVMASIVYFAGALILIHVTFNNNYYYNTAFFRTMVGGLYFVLLAIARFVLVKKVFCDQNKGNAGVSFSFGFGMMPALLASIYMFIMFMIVAINGIFNAPYVLEAEGYLSFADNTIISVFQPASGHLSFALVFAGFAVFAVIFSIFVRKITLRHYHFFALISWVILFLLIEACALMPIPFIMQFSLKHWQLPIIEWGCAGVAALLARFIPGGDHEPDPDYQKQFE